MTASVGVFNLASTHSNLTVMNFQQKVIFLLQLSDSIVTAIFGILSCLLPFERFMTLLSLTFIPNCFYFIYFA